MKAETGARLRRRGRGREQRIHGYVDFERLDDSSDLQGEVQPKLDRR
jgi:hypothetical protein